MKAPSPLTPRVVALVLGALGVLAVLYAWRLPPFTSAIETTDNAYVRGSITIVAPKIDGYVAEVLVRDFEAVEEGQLLVRLDRGNYGERLAQARAQLASQEASLANHLQARLGREAAVASAEAALGTAGAQRTNAAAQLARTQTDSRRAQALVVDGSISARERDQVDGALRQAEAADQQARMAVRQAEAALQGARQDLRATQVNRQNLEAAVGSAKAALGLAELDVGHSEIRAPRAGRVGEVGVKLGQYVTPGTQLMALVPREIWVIANFKESQIRRMRPGQSATIAVDALGDSELKGAVERLAPATGAEFSVIRPDNASGNFTKVVQRIPVRIRIEPGPGFERLVPGMSVIAHVDTDASSP